MWTQFATNGQMGAMQPYGGTTHQHMTITTYSSLCLWHAFINIYFHEMLLQRQSMHNCVVRVGGGGLMSTKSVKIGALWHPYCCHCDAWLFTASPPQAHCKLWRPH